LLANRDEKLAIETAQKIEAADWRCQALTQLATDFASTGKLSASERCLILACETGREATVSLADKAFVADTMLDMAFAQDTVQPEMAERLVQSANTLIAPRSLKEKGDR